MAAQRCRACGCDRAVHGAGTCASCGTCRRFRSSAPWEWPWFVIVSEPERAPRAYGPIPRWSDARKLARVKEDKARGVRTRLVDERPTGMRILAPEALS